MPATSNRIRKYRTEVMKNMERIGMIVALLAVSLIGVGIAGVATATDDIFDAAPEGVDPIVDEPLTADDASDDSLLPCGNEVMDADGDMLQKRMMHRMRMRNNPDASSFEKNGACEDGETCECRNPEGAPKDGVPPEDGEGQQARRGMRMMKRMHNQSGQGQQPAEDAQLEGEE